MSNAGLQFRDTSGERPVMKNKVRTLSLHVDSRREFQKTKLDSAFMIQVLLANRFNLEIQQLFKDCLI